MNTEIIRCGVNTFLRAYSPFFLREGLMRECVDKLVEQGFIERNEDDKSCLKGFNIHDTGDSVLRRIEEIIDVLKTQVPNTTLEFFVCPTPDIRNLSHRLLDACLVSDRRTAHGSLPSPSDIAVAFTVIQPWETYEGDDFENMYIHDTREIKANLQIMNEDPRRVFIYGITFQHDQMKLWYHCRSHSAASQPFNFLAEPELFIKILLSFLSVTPEQLGYDPTVTKQGDGRYVYEIPDPQTGTPYFYQTVSVTPKLDHHLNCFVGPATKVYEVERIASGDDPTPQDEPRCILKDEWLECDIRTEGQLQQNIFEDLEAFWTSQDPEDEKIRSHIEEIFPDFERLLEEKGYKRMFLDITMEAEGKTTVPIAKPFKTWEPIYDAWGRKMSVPDRFPPRRRYRVIFSGLYTPVMELDRLGDVMDVLADSLLGLAFLYCAGWVHRDVSTRSIVAYRKAEGDKWHAKISGLESAAKFGSTPSGAYLQVGHPYFMPTNITRGKLRYDDSDVLLSRHPELFDEFQQLRHKSLAERKDFMHKVTSLAQQCRPPPLHPLFHHDLESLWWIIIYTITSRVPYEPSNRFSKDIFYDSPRIVDTAPREKCYIFDIDETLNTVLHPTLRFLAKPLNFIRFALETTDRNHVLHGTMDVPSAYLMSYQIFHECLNDILGNESSEWRDCRLEVPGRSKNETQDELDARDV